MLDTYYSSVPFSTVTNKNDFFKTQGSLPETIKIKNIINAISLAFKIPQTHIILQVSEGERYYKILLQDNNVSKDILGWFVYLPLDKQRVDLYTIGSSFPLCQWKNKKIAFKNYPKLFDKIGFDKLFDRIINLT